jgi:hypothetical protein
MPQKKFQATISSIHSLRNKSQETSMIFSSKFPLPWQCAPWPYGGMSINQTLLSLYGTEGKRLKEFIVLLILKNSSVISLNRELSRLINLTDRQKMYLFNGTTLLEIVAPNSAHCCNQVLLCVIGTSVLHFFSNKSGYAT